VPLQDSLKKLQLLLIDLEYAVADVAYEANKLPTIPGDDPSLMRRHVYLINVATDNMITAARATTLRDLESEYLLAV
jgi:hypothetical protein